MHTVKVYMAWNRYSEKPQYGRLGHNSSWINGPLPCIDPVLHICPANPTAMMQASSSGALTMTSLLSNGILPIYTFSITYHINIQSDQSLLPYHESCISDHILQNL